MARFPKLHVSGGPHAHNLKITSDDREISGITRAEIILDVNDVARVKLVQIIEADVEIEALAADVYHLRLNHLTTDGEHFEREVIEVPGDPIEAATVPALLRAVADRLEAVPVAAED